MSRTNLLVFAFLLLVTFNCQDDGSKATVSFGKSNNHLEILENSLPDIVSSYGPALFLSQPLSRDLAVNIESSGVAVYGKDFTFPKPFIIPKGETVLSLGLQFINDDVEEFDEAAKLRITSVDDQHVRIDTLSNNFLIKNDDAADLQVTIYWIVAGDHSIDNIDMDIYLWRESSPGSGIFEIVSKVVNRTNPPIGFEGVFVSGLDKDGLYGLSYVYQKGATDNFSFVVTFRPYGSATINGSKSDLVFTPTYKLANINSGEVTIREQFFTKKGFEFGNVTAIVVPPSGS